MTDILIVRQPVFDRSDSAVGYGGRGIQSIGHAIRLAGRTAFVKWIALAFAAARANSSGVDNEILARPCSGRGCARRSVNATP